MILKRWFARSERNTHFSPEQLRGALALAVSLLRKGTLIDDLALFERLVHENIDKRLAARIVEFLPQVYARLLLEPHGVTFPETFERQIEKMKLEKRYADEPVWNAAINYARCEIEQCLSTPDLMAIASRSAEMQAVNKLSQSNSDLKHIRLTSPLYMWPEDGPE